MSLPRILILATGGTIAGVQKEAAAYTAGKLSAKALVSALPDLSSTARISAEQLVNIGSQSMTYAVWRALARRITEVAQNNLADAVVVTHGTDTMEETAYFLHLAVPVDLPVVLTGAMRPANAYAADGPENLFNALRVAATPETKGKGVVVVMNGEIHSARYVQKSACDGLQAFESRETGVMGVVNQVGIKYFYAGPAAKHTTKSELTLNLLALEQNARPNLRVPILYAYAAEDDETLEAILATQPNGIVVAGVGNGNMSDATLSRLQAAAGNGLPVVRASRCQTGFVARNLEVNDDQSKFIVANDLNPQKARVILLLASQKTNNSAEIQKYFDKH